MRRETAENSSRSRETTENNREQRRTTETQPRRSREAAERQRRGSGEAAEMQRRGSGEAAEMQPRCSRETAAALCNGAASRAEDEGGQTPVSTLRGRTTRPARRRLVCCQVCAFEPVNCLGGLSSRLISFYARRQACTSRMCPGASRPPAKAPAPPSSAPPRWPMPRHGGMPPADGFNGTDQWGNLG